MGCGDQEKKIKVIGQDGQVLEITCNRDVIVCGTIDIPFGFSITDKGNPTFGLSACLECITEDIEIECSTGVIDNCGGTFSTVIPVKEVRAVGCINYVFSHPVESTCPTPSPPLPSNIAHITLQDVVCVDQRVCLQESKFKCDPVVAKCDVTPVFISFRFPPEDCTLADPFSPRRIDVRIEFRLFLNICSPGVSEQIPEIQYERIF